MRIHYLQHVPFEDPGFILRWAENKGYHLTGTHFYENEPLPSTEDIDWLIVMGGPMSVHDKSDYSWMIDEKKFIKKCVELDKTILGICLGAQLIAETLDASVFKNSHKEIGWYPIRIDKRTEIQGLCDDLPETFNVFHWHGETFDLPKNADLLAKSEGCINQAFLYGKRVLALQFHLEMTQKGVNRLIENCASDMTPGIYVQTGESMRELSAHTAQNHAVMSSVLDYLESVTLT